MNPIGRDDYAAWILDTFGSGQEIWRNGLHPGALTTLKGESRARAEKMLRFGIAIGDATGAEAVAFISPSWAPALLRRAISAHQANASFVVAAVKGLAKMGAAGAHHSLLCDVLVSTVSLRSHWGPRIDAARALRAYEGVAAAAARARIVNALCTAVATDAEYLVRVHAAETVLVFCRHPPEISAFPIVWEHFLARRNKDGRKTYDARPTDFRRFHLAAEMLRGLYAQTTKREKKQ